MFPMRRKVPDMPSSTPLSPDTRTRLTRRGVLTLPALAGAWAVLAGCGALKKDGVASSGKSLGAASPRAAVATSPGPHGGVPRPHVLLPPRLVPTVGWCSVRSIKVLR